MSPDEILRRASTILRSNPGLQREFLASLGIEARLRAEFRDDEGALRSFEGSIAEWREELHSMEQMGWIDPLDELEPGEEPELDDFYYEILLERRLIGGDAYPHAVFEAADVLLDRGDLMPEDLQ